MTIKDIATLSGYGVGTVSRVLNNKPDVSEKARKIIQETIDKYNFQPNANAQQLKKISPSTIFLIVKGTQNMLFSEVIERIQILFLQKDESLEVAYIDEDANEVIYATQLCKERNPKGIIFLGGNTNYFREYFHEIDVPCILVTNDARELDFPNLSSFTTFDEEAAAQVIEYLLERGHKNIGVLGGNQSGTICLRRLSGCNSSFAKHHMHFDMETSYEACRFSMEEGYQATLALLKKNPSITAIFALGDVIAIGALRAIQDLGKKIPEDISIVGFDGISLSDYCIPRLTTVYQDTECMAIKTVDSILHRINYNYEPVHQKIPFRLIERESVGTRL